MAIFGRMSARQRLRRAARESLTIPAFSSSVDCTPWVTGGLWPVELSTNTRPETATLAEYLKVGLRRITRSANDELRTIRLAGLPDAVRQAEEARVIEAARARAVRRVESTMRQLHAFQAKTPAAGEGSADTGSPTWAELEKTEAIPSVTEPAPAPTEVIPEPTEVVEEDQRDEAPESAPAADESAAEEEAPEVVEGRHRAAVAGSAAAPTAAGAPAAPIIPAAPEAPAAEAPAAAVPPEAPVAPSAPAAPEAPATAAPLASESDTERLRRLLAFVVHQEPRLNWAIGDRPDGTTLLVTDFAHGWVPPGIAVPEGVRLLEPDRRKGKVSALLGETTHAVTYAPGDAMGRLDDFAETTASAQPRELPAVDDPGWQLSQATHWRDGLPRMVHTLARAAAAGTGVAEEEIDLLRVHLDTARYQLLIQYPNIDPPLFLNCLLLAATEGVVTGDAVSANYHLAWFQKLNAPTDGL